MKWAYLLLLSFCFPKRYHKPSNFNFWLRYIRFCKWRRQKFGRFSLYRYKGICFYDKMLNYPSKPQIWPFCADFLHKSPLAWVFFMEIKKSLRKFEIFRKNSGFTKFRPFFPKKRYLETNLKMELVFRETFNYYENWSKASLRWYLKRYGGDFPYFQYLGFFGHFKPKNGNFCPIHAKNVGV